MKPPKDFVGEFRRQKEADQNLPCTCSNHLRVAALEREVAEAVKLLRELLDYDEGEGMGPNGTDDSDWPFRETRAFLAKRERGEKS